MAVTSAVKEMNIAIVRKYMRQHFEASKSDIARETKMSIPTVTRIIDLLCASGEMLDKGHGKVTGGRSAGIYTLNINYSLCLLIKIEGTEIDWTIKNQKGQLVSAKHLTVQSGILELLDSQIIKLEKEYVHLKTIVIGISAMVTNNTIKETTEFAELKGVNMPLHFMNLTDIPVHIENDMNIVAMGQWFRSRKKSEMTVCIYLGDTCFGASVIRQGEVWRGTTNFAGELSFLPAYECSVEAARENYKNVDMIELYTKLIQLYTVLLNPNQIILYSNKYISENISEVRRRCNARLPLNDIPQIELSSEYLKDYEEGLYATARKILDETCP